MVAGQSPLRTRLLEHRSLLRGNVLEVGPFFTLLVTRSCIPEASVMYWENDPDALVWLSRTYATNNSTDVIPMDVGSADTPGCLDSTDARLRARNAITFDVVVLSQVMNYVDYRMLLGVVAALLRPGGLLAVNNVVNYGLPLFFSHARPGSVSETINVVKDGGFSVFSSDVSPAETEAQGGEPRLVLLAERSA
jgi:hypothetical protein